MNKEKWGQGRQSAVRLLLVTFVVLYLQHYFVGMYFDDYGYASLSYGWIGNLNGMQYGISDILRFLYWQYHNWGGRVLYFFFEVMAFHLGGVRLLQVLQSFVIAGIIVLEGKIVSHNFKQKITGPMCGAFGLLLYGTITLTSARDGIYWYTASVLYVWPIFPFLLGVYLCEQKKSETLLSKIAIFFLFFLAAFSQEQVAVLVVVYCLFYIGVQALKRKEKAAIRGFALFGAMSGGAIEILAPGNFVRASDPMYAAFSEKNIIEKILQNLPQVIEINIGTYNTIFAFVLTIFLGMQAARAIKNKYLAKTWVFFVAYAGWLIVDLGVAVPEMVQVVQVLIRVLWILALTVVLTVYYYSEGKTVLLALYWAGLCSQGMLLVSPSISNRSHIIFELILHILLIDAFAALYLRKKCIEKRLGLIGICAVGIYAVFNYGYILRGYAMNNDVMMRNHYNMLEAANEYATTNETAPVILYTLPDDRFANSMPYQPGEEFIGTWMKIYYELPQETQLIWEDAKVS